jgi:hypothetical protein
VLIFSKKKELFRWNVFPAIIEWYFLPPGDLVLCVAYCRTVGKAPPPSWPWMPADWFAFWCYVYKLSLHSALWHSEVFWITSRTIYAYAVAESIYWFLIKICDSLISNWRV